MSNVWIKANKENIKKYFLQEINEAKLEKINPQKINPDGYYFYKELNQESIEKYVFLSNKGVLTHLHHNCYTRLQAIYMPDEGLIEEFKNVEIFLENPTTALELIDDYRHCRILFFIKRTEYEELLENMAKNIFPIPIVIEDISIKIEKI